MEDTQTLTSGRQTARLMEGNVQSANRKDIMQTLWWQFTIVHTPGKLQPTVDALLRRKTKLPATIYKLRVCEPDDKEDDVANDLKTRFEHHFPEPDTSDLTEEETAAAYSILSLKEISAITRWPMRTGCW